MRPAGLERAAQRRAGREQVGLSDVLIEDARPQPVGQRSVGALARPGHLLSRPITSTPGGPYPFASRSLPLASHVRVIATISTKPDTPCVQFGETPQSTIKF